MIGTWAQRLWRHIPARCAVCHAWPARAVCDACVQQFAQPVTHQLDSLFQQQHKILTVADRCNFVWLLIALQCVARASTI